MALYEGPPGAHFTESDGNDTVSEQKSDDIITWGLAEFTGNPLRSFITCLRLFNIYHGSEVSMASYIRASSHHLLL